MEEDTDLDAALDWADDEEDDASKTWKDVESRLASVQPTAVPGLSEAADLEPYWGALRGLAGHSPLDLILRFQAIHLILQEEARLQSESLPMMKENLKRLLYWLAPDARNRVLKALRQYGWLEHAEGRWHTSSTGRRVFAFLSPLLDSTDEAGLLEAAVMAGAAQDMQHPVLRQLRVFIAQAQGQLDGIQRARQSRSSVRMREARDRLQDTLMLSAHILRVNEQGLSDPAAQKEILAAHRVLASMKNEAAQLERDVTEVERQQIRLPVGYTLDHLTKSLMATTKEELATVGGAAIRPVYRPTVFLEANAALDAAEAFFEKDRTRPQEVDWSGPDAMQDAVPFLEEMARHAEDFRDHLKLAFEKEDRVPIHKLILADSPEESMLRLTLAGVLGHDERGSGVMQELAQLELRMETDGETVVELPGKSLSLVSKGVVRRMKK